MNDKVLVCMTKQMGEWNPKDVVNGSVVKFCTECNIEVYVAVSGQKMLAADKEVKLICMNCALKFMKEDHQICVVPGGIAEAKEHDPTLNIPNSLKEFDSEK